MSCPSLSSGSKIFHGDFFSVFGFGPDSYWVVSNDYPSVFNGPLDMRTALKLASSSNEYFNTLKTKGLY